MTDSSPNLKYRQREGVIQYLGVKYASIKDKFAVPELWELKSLSDLDGSSHGPSAISVSGALEFEYVLIQKDLPVGNFPVSDLNCLNLNITVPEKQHFQPDGQLLPVFVFIHGGGLTGGSNAWPQYDHARFVKQSSDLGKAVIGVGINYRLGPYGFLTSEELRNNGYPGNNGLRDQREALKWIKKFISAFGGDADNVTCIGESAGAVSSMLQLQSSEPLFKRVVSMSGTPLMMPPLPAFVHESSYQTVIKSLGIDQLPATDRIKALLEMPSHELVSKLPPGLPLLPLLDGDMIKTAASFSGIKDSTECTQNWCQDLLIGSLEMDASVFGSMMPQKKAGCAGLFMKAVEAIIPQDASKVLDMYNISNDTSDEEAWLSIMRFATDINFHAPAAAFANAWHGNSYLYRFNEGNPWDGPWKGHATHVLDVAYLFLNYTEHLEAGSVVVAKSFATDVIKFINGEELWAAESREAGLMKEYNSSEAKTSGKEIWKELSEEVPLDSLTQVWTAFMMSP